jgi:DNA invertase Pin-like site-specific DNA recombinase
MSGNDSIRKPAVSYYRVSTEKQDSLPAQREWARRVAQQGGLTLAGEFEDEGISGASFDRPGLQDMLAFVEKRFYAREPVGALLVVDLDRLSRRNSLDTGALLSGLSKYGLRYVVTSAQRFDLRSQLDRTLIALGSDFTREPELRARSNHVLVGMADRARKGLWMGGPPPLGYRTAPDLSAPPSKSGRQPVRLVLGPEEEQEVVRWAFRAYASGRVTANGVARELNARGLRPRRAGRWSRNTVLKMLANRAYLGCVVWGGQRPGKYHELKGGNVVPREDREDREQAQLLRTLKRLPVRLAEEEDLIVCPSAHPALIDPETFEACQRQRERNRENHSAPRGAKGNPGLAGNVWPLAGQMRCGHCGEPVWTMPVGERTGRGRLRHGTYVERARVCCSGRRKDPSACPHSGALPYVEVLGRVIDLLKGKLAEPGAVEELTREYERQQREQARSGQGDRKRLADRAAELDGKIGRAVANLAQIAADLRADVEEHVRGLKAERDAVGQRLRDLDAQQRDGQGIDPEGFQATLEAVAGLSADWEGREEAELLRATLRDLVAEVRLYFRARRPGEKMPLGRQATKRVLGRIEVDLTPSFADLTPPATGRSACPPPAAGTATPPGARCRPTRTPRKLSSAPPARPRPSPPESPSPARSARSDLLPAGSRSSTPPRTS